MRPQPESGTSPPSSAGSARSRPRKGAARGPPEGAPAEASTTATALEGALPLAVGRLTAWVVLPAAVVGELGEIVRWVEAQTWDRVWTALQAAGAKERLLTTEVLEALARALDRQWDELGRGNGKSRDLLMETLNGLAAAARLNPEDVALLITCDRTWSSKFQDHGFAYDVMERVVSPDDPSRQRVKWLTLAVVLLFLVNVLLFLVNSGWLGLLWSGEWRRIVRPSVDPLAATTGGSALDLDELSLSGAPEMCRSDAGDGAASWGESTDRVQCHGGGNVEDPLEDGFVVHDRA